MHENRVLTFLLLACVATLAEPDPGWRRGLEPLAGAWRAMASGNLEVQSAEARLQAGQEAVAAARSTRLPRVDLSGSYQYTTEVANMDLQLPALIPGGSAMSLHKELGDHDRAEMGVLASYAVFTGFAQKAQVDAATWQMKARQESREALLAALGMRMAALHWQVQRVRNSMELWQAEDSVLNNHVHTLQALQSKGQGTAAVVLAARADAARHFAEGVRARLQLDSLRAEFVLLTGNEYPEALLQAPWEEWREPILGGGPQRDDLAVARSLTAQSLALRAQEGSLASGAWPTVSVFAGWKAGNPGLAQTSDEWMSYGIAGAQLQWNLFDGGVRRHARSQVVSESRAVEREGDRLVEQQQVAWKQLALEADNIKAQRVALLAADSAARLAEHLQQVALREGNASVDDVRDAQLKVVQIASQLRNLNMGNRMVELRAAWLSGETMAWEGVDNVE
jgi:outer membrane protein TolC